MEVNGGGKPSETGRKQAEVSLSKNNTKEIQVLKRKDGLKGRPMIT